MLDLHVLPDGTGSTSLVTYTTIPANDGAVTAGVPILSDAGKARLVAWGAVGIDATKAIKQWALYSNDLNDPANASVFTPSGTIINIATPHMLENLAYKSAARVVKAAQKAAGLLFLYTIDHYEPPDASPRAKCIMGDYYPPNRGIYSSTFAGALTAQAWGTKSLAPTYNLPAGKYALLGFWAEALTNLAAVRFQHADFGMCQPGCIVADNQVIVPTLATLSGDEIMSVKNGYQFVAFGEITHKPQCPVFTAGPNGTGLNIQAFDNTADTPSVIVNLAYLGA